MQQQLAAPGPRANPLAPPPSKLFSGAVAPDGSCTAAEATVAPTRLQCSQPWTPTKGERLIFHSLAEMAEYIAAGQVALVDAVFCDPLGTWHHCTFAPSQCSLSDLETGFAFDASSIKLFKSVHQSDMLMKPDYTTCWIDPFCRHRTLHVGCSVTDPLGEPYERCPRQIAQKAAALVQELNIADISYFGPEPEFFVFDHIRFNVNTEEIAVELDGDEGCWNSSRGRLRNQSFGGAIPDVFENNLGHRMPKKQMYFPVGPTDRMMDIRSDMLLTMGEIGIPIEKHHHELGACQNELGITFSRLVETADHMMTYKYVVKNVAWLHNKTASFMPKPMIGDCGSGCHVHQSLWKDGENLFYDPNGEYLKLSQQAMYYIGGILRHAAAVIAFTNPTTNSYKRLVPGYEAPCSLFFSKGNRTAAIRIPLCDSNNPRSKRIECRFPDASSCPYICFSVLLMAGLDGIINKIEPPPALDLNMDDVGAQCMRKVPSVPASLSEALDALATDNEFLLRGGVFKKDFINAYIQLKRVEIRSVDSIPHPKEFELYYNA